MCGKPSLQAMCRGVHPSSSLWWISAPWWTSSFTHSRFPDRTASWIAAIPTCRSRERCLTIAMPVGWWARQRWLSLSHRRGRWCPGWLSWLGWNVRSSPAPLVSRSLGRRCRWGSAHCGPTWERMSVRSWTGGRSPGRKAWSSSPGRQGTDNTSSRANSQRDSWKNWDEILRNGFSVRQKGQAVAWTGL